VVTVSDHSEAARRPVRAAYQASALERQKSHACGMGMEYDTSPKLGAGPRTPPLPYIIHFQFTDGARVCLFLQLI
jgi:hypothetical protein